MVGGGGGLDPTGDAIESDVLYNKVFSNADGIDKVGTMPNIGAVSPSPLTPGGSYTVPEGYHNGNGVVEAASNTGTYSPTTRNAALDMGADNLNRYVDTTGVPNANSETYTPTSNGSALDMGATNTYRYVNTNMVYNLGRGDGTAFTGYAWWFGACDISNLTVGSYNIYAMIVLWNASGTKTWSVLSSDVTISSSISGGTIAADWTGTDPGIKKYAVDITSSTNKFTLTATPKSPYTTSGIFIIAFKK